jgi:Zn-dependent M28 family amino/carboxypeptidase
VKTTIAILLMIFSLNCKPPVKTQIKNHSENINQIKESVEFLTSDGLLGRKLGSEGIETAATYIEKVFKKSNIKPYFESYRDSFKVKDLVGYNIVGFIEGNDPKLKSEVVIIGAHYDHIGVIKPVGNDSIANGANDNAAGTSAVLALAEYFSKERTNKRSLIISLFSGEEMGLLGSRHLANRLKNANIDLYAMFNFEMIGVPFKDRDYLAFVTGYDLSNMAQVLNAYLGAKVFGKSDVAVKYNLFKRSDNYPFYEAFQVPCQTISSCDLSNFDYYHHVDDEVDKLDFQFMSLLIDKMIPALEKSCNSPIKEIKMTNE